MKDGGFIFHAKDDGKQFLINELHPNAATATQENTASSKENELHELAGRQSITKVG